MDYEELGRTEVFHFTTEDGLRLEGYLTKPKEGKAPYPTVCLVHGGPRVRDSGTYDQETQFLVNRGYAVLRVNYRGSSGFGKAVSYRDRFDFRRMNDDITEAVKMAIKAGIADPDKIAIMGASFGGYAAMCGATFEPDLYQAAVSLMGVFDWEELIVSLKRNEHPYAHDVFRKGLQPGGLGREAFRKISPLYHVDKIRCPVFLAHGKNDKRVSVKQTKALEGQLKKHGIPHETFYAGGERHRVFEMKYRVDLYDQIIEFLDEHVKR